MPLKNFALALYCCAVLSSCGGGGAPYQPRAGEGFSMLQTPAPGTSLGDVASAITADTLLRYRGARLLKAEPFPPCPGEAGWQTFSLHRGNKAMVLRVAFTVWNGVEKVARYERPASHPDDTGAIGAMRRIVCTGT